MLEKVWNQTHNWNRSYKWISYNKHCKKNKRKKTIIMYTINKDENNSRTEKSSCFKNLKKKQRVREIESQNSGAINALRKKQSEIE